MLRRGGSPWAAVSALATASFCFGTTENLPIGLLQPIATSFHTTLSRVGLLVTGYAVMVVIVSVPLTRMVVGVARRRLLCALLVVFVVSTLATGAAPGYWSMFGARLVSSLAQAVFWPVASVAAAAMFSPKVRGRAASVVFGGGSAAIVLGVPFGTWLGQHLGWRSSFVALGCLGGLSLLALFVFLPGGGEGTGERSRADTPDARRYWIVVATTALAITGFYTAYTYITPLLTRVAHFSAHSVSTLLFLYGTTDLLGLVAAGTVVDRGPRRLMVVAIGVLCTGLAGMYLFGDGKVGAVITMALIAAPIPALVAAMQLMVLHVAPGDLDTASAGTSAAFNVGIGSGALAGGLILPVYGVHATPLAGAVPAVAALALFCGGTAMTRGPRRPPGPQGQSIQS